MQLHTPYLPGGNVNNLALFSDRGARNGTRFVYVFDGVVAALGDSIVLPNPTRLAWVCP